MTREIYLSDLTTELHRRGVEEGRIAEIVAEVETHLDDGGESPVDAFGPPAEYAEQMAVFAERSAAAATPDHYHHRIFRATAFDEMGILKHAGQDGWELVDVGPWALFCRRPAETDPIDQWEYRRRTGTFGRVFHKEMAADDWQPCGSWVVFHYFKRRTGTHSSVPRAGGA